MGIINFLFGTPTKVIATMYITMLIIIIIKYFMTIGIPFETIDRIQDILSIPAALWMCYALWDIRRTIKN